VVSFTPLPLYLRGYPLDRMLGGPYKRNENLSLSHQVHLVRSLLADPDLDADGEGDDRTFICY
jgi:hypothetical protein